jgi:large subunit ribosomal protein L10
MPTPKKEEIVSDVAEQMKSAQGVVLTEYRGLTVAQVSELRKQLRDSGTTFAVVKNTLFKRAVADLVEPSPQLDETLNGPTAVGFATKDAVETAKAFVDYIAANRNTPLKVKGAVVGGKFFDAKQVEALSKVPPRPVLYAQLLGSFNSPISGLVGTLNGVISNLVYTLQALHDKREGGSEGA